MKWIVFIILCCCNCIQAQDAATLYNTGKTFLNQGDYDNAILVLKRACAAAPNTFEYEKDLGYAYFYKGDYDNAGKTVERLLDQENSDQFVFLLAGNISLLKKDLKNAEKYYKKGLKKFPESGMLFNACGEVLWNQKEPGAIKQWEKGIELDPNFSGNYYNAAIYYYLSKNISDKLWCLYYGEIFVNLEIYSTRTIEIKGLLLDSYKKIFSDGSFFKTKSNNGFETAFKQSLEKADAVASKGIRTETLIMMRTIFVLDWFHNPVKPKNSLFEKQEQLLKEGLFEAYNYWLFESVANLTAFETWTLAHKPEYNGFTKYNQNKIFRIGEKEYPK
jgi:tetratricopeptide (TPR) repeat protein